MNVLPWRSDATETNRPPAVRIIYPETGALFYNALYVRVKAEATGPDGSISEVRLYLDGNPVNTVTNAPYNFVAQVKTFNRQFSAVARDDKGAETQSTVIDFSVSEAPVDSIILLEPRVGTIVPARADLVIHADLVAIYSQSRTNQLAFYLNGQVIGTAFTERFAATNAPVTLTLTNLSEGEHEISVGINTGAFCACPVNRIRAVNLALRDPILTPDNKLDFEVITAFPGRTTVIQYSTNFVDWSELQTITPDTNYFRLVAPIEPATSRRWYRASVAEGP
jgi:hypothetical protein